MLMQYLPPALTGILAVEILWSWRSERRVRSETRVRQLQQAAELLAAHGTALARILDGDATPRVLKQALVHSSDALTDRSLVLIMAKLLADGERWEALQDDAEIIEAAESLRRSDPDAFAAFKTAAITGAFSAILRWPESAVFFEEISAKLAADPRRDVDVVVTTSRARNSGLPFGVRASLPAVALG